MPAAEGPQVLLEPREPPPRTTFPARRSVAGGTRETRGHEVHAEREALRGDVQRIPTMGLTTCVRPGGDLQAEPVGRRGRDDG